MNLIGEHTDYNEGFVLPLAIDRWCVVAAKPARSVRLRSLDTGDEIDAWRRLVASVARELGARGRPPVGIDATLASGVPLGSGLASSAALEVGFAVALAEVAGWQIDRADLAEACRRAEEEATGVPCGIMDQLASVAGRDGHALLIDCRSRSVEPVPLPAGLAVLVVGSGVARSLASTGYAERRRACEALARRLGIAALRDGAPEQVAGEPLGRHVVSENVRVLAAADALRDGDLEALGRILADGHASLRDDFGVSTPELDALVEELVDAGAFGARLTGAGFGGSVVAVCDAGSVHDVQVRATAAYRKRTGREATAFVCRAVAGAAAFDP